MEESSSSTTDGLRLLCNQNDKFKEEVSVSCIIMNHFECLSDEELCVYLLPLVQALRRYERGDECTGKTSVGVDLSKFLYQRGVKNPSLGVLMYWYMKSSEEGQSAQTLPEQQGGLLKQLSHWEEENPKDEASLLRGYIQMQVQYVNHLKEVSQRVSSWQCPTIKKTNQLKECLKSEYSHLLSFEPMPLPVSPDILVQGLNVDKAMVIKSAQSPLRLTFTTPMNHPYGVIFTREDMRQDMCITVLIELIDNVLKKEGLVLPLKTMKIVSFNKLAMIQHLSSTASTAKSLFEVLSEGTIQDFFKKHQGDTDSPYGISAQWDRFTRSYAVWTVVCYILGIGDRQLDNCYITASGEIYQEEFYFIFGRNPLPLPPPMHLHHEIVKALEAPEGSQFLLFKSYCKQAYKTLRKYADLLAYFLSLLSESGMIGNREGAVPFLKDKLRLELNDDEAADVLDHLIGISCLPPITLKHTNFVKYWL